jgi:glycosyltransferase involved in cell wall biosynthesis
MSEKVALLMVNQPLREALGQRAREKLTGGFTPDVITPHILSVCRRLAGKKPTVSVIVPNYNHAPYLEQRLKSIFDQTFKDYEVILLDDASSDQSLEVLNRYAGQADTRIVQNEKNSGSPFQQWLKGIDLASSDLLWIAESDDACAPNFLQGLIPAFADPRVKLAYGNSHIMNEDGEMVGDYLGTNYLSSLSTEKWKRSYKIQAEQEINDGLGIKNTILNISAVLVSRFEMDPEFRETLRNMRIAGDWYFIIHAIQGGHVVYNSRKLNFHRRHSKSVIAQTVSDKRIQEFFHEFFLVQRDIIKSYCLHPDFVHKWEGYLREQWNDFSGGRPFPEISVYYPFEAMKREIITLAGATHAE